MHCSLHPELAPQCEIYILRQDRETVAGDENRLFSCKGFFYDFFGGFFQDSFEEDDDLGLVPADYVPEFAEENVADDLSGFGLQDENGDDIVENTQFDEYDDQDNI